MSQKSRRSDNKKDQNSSYRREDQPPIMYKKPQTELSKLSKQETKTILIARFGMLECGKN